MADDSNTTTKTGTKPAATTAGTNQANADANANAAQQQPGGTTPQTDPTQPADPDAGNTVGGPNPSQPQAGPTGGNTVGEVGQTVGSSTVRLPSEGVGYSPRPADDTGNADSNGVAVEQTVQRLAPMDHAHPIAEGLGVITNIPAGSRPMMRDPATGLGLVPPQTGATPAEPKAVEAGGETTPKA